MKRFIAAFDVGTTAVKGVIVSTAGEVVFSSSINIETIFEQDHKEQSPLDWYDAFCQISKGFFQNGYVSKDFLGIVMSGQMQDLILIDKENQPVCNAILYSDGRATKQAEHLISKIGFDRISEVTGNNFDGSMPFAKLLWVKENKKDIYNNIHKILISAKDYCMTRLTGNYAADAVSASTAGLMDIHTKKWMYEWCIQEDIDTDILPDIYYTDSKAGIVSALAAEETGYAQGTPVYCGTGDAGATTLASGIHAQGDYNINLGTSGWIACISDDVLPETGVFNLAAIQRDVYINVVPFLNAGNVHKWISSVMTPDGMQSEKYHYAAQLLEESSPGSHGLLAIPYLVGERFPVMDTNIKGCFIGATPETTKQDMVRACLEGVAFSIKYGIEKIGRTPESVSIIGGGAKESVWCQIIADIIGQPVKAYGISEYLPSVAICSAVLIGEGLWQDYSQLKDFLAQSGENRIFEPNMVTHTNYLHSYNRFKKILPLIRTIFK